MINPGSLPIYDSLLCALKSEDFFPFGATLAYGCVYAFACVHLGPARHRACTLQLHEEGCTCKPTLMRNMATRMLPAQVQACVCAQQRIHRCRGPRFHFAIAAVVVITLTSAVTAEFHRFPGQLKGGDAALFRAAKALLISTAVKPLFSERNPWRDS